ncbi:hypothetical protein Tco_1116075 [Tanacetum coccineum]
MNAKYESCGQDTRIARWKDDQAKDKDLKISDEKDNDKGSRSKITKHEGTSLKLDIDKDQRIYDKSNLNDLTK